MNHKNFIAINESFTCKNCGTVNKKHETSYRNHCTVCLYSLHVDKDTPGDRKSTCKSLMKPVKTEQSGKKGWLIHHKCTKCGKIMPNIVAEDDNFEKIIELSQPAK